MIDSPRRTREPLEVLVGFGRALRAAGVPATPDRVQQMINAIDLVGGPVAPAQVYWPGRLTTCASRADIARYDAMFEAYFSDQRPVAGRPGSQPRMVVPVALPVAGDGDEPDGAPRDADRRATASEIEILRTRDVTELSGVERDLARSMVARLRVGAPTRTSRRRRPAGRGEVDRGRSVRAVLRRGGEPALLERHARVRRPRRLVLLVDISGSMAPYAEWLLVVAHAAVRARQTTEVFTIGTRLTRVTRELRRADPELALRAAFAEVPDWSGGTRLGAELREFLRSYGRRGVARGAVVVIASDGWERGDPALLGTEMATLARLAHKIVWVNPHRGRDGFAPVTAGMAAALPSIDRLVAGHSVAAYEDLARLLSTEEVRVGA